eukprot:TRINITY_DN16637_c0_g1_i1.p1 TRINITY_DN16637_c0_g1~~TRINITY_DN16637_c0_g1_i1.p1  ORF type:complete len:192 (-),score=30.68 TRINITY_DN16637_c0_g1_i1:21-596(-)
MCIRDRRRVHGGETKSDKIISTPRFSVGETKSDKIISTPRFSVGSKYLTPEGNLTTSIKKQILLNNIYGVDIDTNAVEVTKLSLMLKALEGETEATINNQLTLLHERVLPTLDNNIKSGNSLIDVDFYDNQIDFEPGVEKKIKPFNWESNFPEVFKPVSYTHLRAHETRHDLVCRLLLEKKKKKIQTEIQQ